VDTAEAFRSLESVTGHDLSSEDGRFGARDIIAAVLRPWFEARTLDEVRTAFDGTGVSWGPYQTFRQLVEEDPRASEENPLFSTIEQPGIGSYLVPASPLELTASGRAPARPAPVLGEHTEPILAEVLGLGAAEIGRLFDSGVVA
jgi:2-methylfumaryl-CoA isomerase